VAETTQRLAAVDVGSNTVHVLVADVRAGQLEDVAHYVEMPELGRAVDHTGQIGSAAEIALEALRRILGHARQHGYHHLLAGATAAVRRAADGPQFLIEASATLGVPVRLISEEREAQLSFLGVTSRHAAPGRWVMVDLGGGSTELICAEARHAVGWASLPIGSGGSAARYLSDPPQSEERAALRNAIRETLARAPEWPAERLVVTGGTASNLPILLSATRSDLVLTVAELDAATAYLDAGPAVEVACRTGLPEARVRALRGGVEVLRLLLEQYHLDQVQVSHAGLRHGMILAYLARGEDWWR
jgi:exopolyphosphatase/guanosine-5'-triphosphate,3'-diphosphate pyrophosphatase